MKSKLVRVKEWIGPLRPGPIDPLPPDPAKALAQFFLIMEAWRVDAATARTLLGSPPRGQYLDWRDRRSTQVPDDVLERIGHITGIYKRLQTLYADPHLADDWVKRVDSAFAGQSPLQRMATDSVSGLATLRANLDAGNVS
jgi:hypothetical protein